MFRREGWTPAPRDEARRELASAIAGERWIIDGNFLGPEANPDARFERADTVIFLDLPRRLCLWRVLSRRVRDHRRLRLDLPEGCREGVDLALLAWMRRFPATVRPRVLGLLAQLDDGVAVHHLRSRADIRRFLDLVSSQSTSSR